MVVLVLDSDLVARLRFKLQNSDLDSATPRIIRRQLEKDLGADLSDRKAFIREQIQIFIDNASSQPVEDRKEHGDGTKRDNNDVVMGEAEKGSTKLNEEEDEVKKNRNAYNSFLGVAEVSDDEDEGTVNKKRDEKREKDVQKESNVQTNSGGSVDGEVAKRGGRNDKLCKLSPQMQDFMGVSELSRREVFKKLWAYIKENNLQDPEKKSIIFSDERLRTLFNVDKFHSFLMPRLMSKHMFSLNGAEDEDEGGVNEKRDEKREKDVQKESNVQTNNRGSTIVEVGKRGGRNDKLCRLSPQLQDFMGVSELSRSEVCLKLWAYIREHNLQDPEKKSTIICDERLRTLFNVKKFYSSSMNKKLDKHMFSLNGAEEIEKPKVKPVDGNDSNSVGDNAVHKDADQEDKRDGDEQRDKKSEKDVKKQGRSTKVDGEVAKRGGRLYSLSPQLKDIMGVSELTRQEVFKKLWAYIREQKLQDPKNGRTIFCDERLRAISDVDSFSMFQMSKILFKHMLPVKGAKGTRKPKVKPEDGNSSKKVGDNAVPEADREDNGEGNDKSDKKRKKDVNKESSVARKKGRSTKADGEVTEKHSRFNHLRTLTPQLQELMGGESKMGRTDVGRKLWAYIGEHNLQDPKNRKTILCDERLRALFDVDSVDCFHMQKLLSKHLLPLNGEQAKDNSVQEARGVKQVRANGETNNSESEPERKRQKECEST